MWIGVCGRCAGWLGKSALGVGHRVREGDGVVECLCAMPYHGFGLRQLAWVEHARLISVAPCGAGHCVRVCPFAYALGLALLPRGEGRLARGIVWGSGHFLNHIKFNAHWQYY